jgi:hypothetical protein
MYRFKQFKEIHFTIINDKTSAYVINLLKNAQDIALNEIPIFNPTSKLISMWNSFLLLMIIVHLIIFPFKNSFYLQELKDHYS